jgi:hypothetical protein
VHFVEDSEAFCQIQQPRLGFVVRHESVVCGPDDKMEKRWGRKTRLPLLAPLDVGLTFGTVVQEVSEHLQEKVGIIEVYPDLMR